MVLSDENELFTLTGYTNRLVKGVIMIKVSFCKPLEPTPLLLTVHELTVGMFWVHKHRMQILCMAQIFIIMYNTIKGIFEARQIIEKGWWNYSKM